jgi:hypothetical protein
VFFWLGLAAQVIWSSNYLIWDMYAFSMPVYVLASLPLAVGVDALLRRTRHPLRTAALVSLLLPAALYPLVTGVPVLARLGRSYTALYQVTAFGLEKEYAETRDSVPVLPQVAAGMWDPSRYLLNPARARYREVKEYCEGVLDRLPPNAHFWDDDSKGGYPLHYYYLGLAHDRPDVTLHLLLDWHVTVESASQEAQAMRSVLERGGEVFVSTVEWPEREPLIQLSQAIRTEGDAESLRRLKTEAFLSSIPGLAITAVPLGTRPGLAVYRVRLR